MGSTPLTRARGKKFRDAREKQRLTQQEVADKAGLNVSHYAKVERGDQKAELDTLEKISNALKLNLKKDIL